MRSIMDGKKAESHRTLCDGLNYEDWIHVISKLVAMRDYDQLAMYDCLHSLGWTEAVLR